ncbi:MAG: hypothetical protein ABJP66_19190 [Hyphomicrobiales bacterium]
MLPKKSGQTIWSAPRFYQVIGDLMGRNDGSNALQPLVEYTANAGAEPIPRVKIGMSGAQYDECCMLHESPP